MSKPDWDLIKNEYEVLHLNVKELSQRHHIGESMLQLAVDEGKWELADIETSDVGEDSQRLALMQSRNDMSLVPLFIRLQGKMLKKCEDLIDGAESLAYAKELKLVSEIIEVHRPAIMGNKDEIADSGTTIRIMNQFGDKGVGAISAVEITQSAGDSNGVGAIELLPN